MRAGGRRDRWWSKLTGRWQDVVDEYEDGLLRAQLDSLPDHVNKLPRGEVSRHQVLLLVDIGDVAPPGLLHDDRDPVRVLLADPQGLGLAFLCARAREREREFKGSESGGKKERVSESRSLRKGASLSRRRGGGATATSSLSRALSRSRRPRARGTFRKRKGREVWERVLPGTTRDLPRGCSLLKEDLFPLIVVRAARSVVVCSFACCLSFRPSCALSPRRSPPFFTLLKSWCFCHRLELVVGSRAWSRSKHVLNFESSSKRGLTCWS